jgi:hypothetical protein
VAIEDLRQPPFKARIEFYKIFTSPLGHTEQKRGFWTANVVYTFRDQVRNEMLPINPLGLTITYFREDKDSVGSSRPETKSSGTSSSVQPPTIPAGKAEPSTKESGSGPRIQRRQLGLTIENALQGSRSASTLAFGRIERRSRHHP